MADNFGQILAREAYLHGSNAEGRLLEAHRQRQLLLEQIADIDADILRLSRMGGRAAKFKPTGDRDGDYYCPKCWVTADRLSALEALPGTDKLDRFRCVCGSAWEIEA
jgi:hypothetical protein